MYVNVGSGGAAVSDRSGYSCRSVSFSVTEMIFLGGVVSKVKDSSFFPTNNKNKAR